MDGNNTPHSARRNIRGLKRLLVGATGASLLTQCTTQPVTPQSDTTRWVTLAQVNTDQQELINDYRNAFQKFEAATDAMLMEVKKTRTRLAGDLLLGRIPFWDGLNLTVVIRPNIAGFPGDCLINASTVPEKPIAKLPSVITMLDAYIELCRLQNQISLDLAQEAKLFTAPSGNTIECFLMNRLEQLNPHEQISRAELASFSGWFANPLEAVRTFMQVRAEFGPPQPQPPRDITEFKEKLELADKYSFCTIPPSVTLAVNEERHKYFIPTHQQLLELSQEYFPDSSEMTVINKLLELGPPEKESCVDYEKEMTILTRDASVRINVQNPYKVVASQMEANPNSGPSR